MAYMVEFKDFKPSGRTVGGKRVAAGIDIDGCVDPGMYKHETGFALASIFQYNMQMATPDAMRAWMFVNCYSKTRGISRFQALYTWLDTLKQIPAVVESGVVIPELTYLRRWTNIPGQKFSPESLKAYVEKGDYSQILQTGDSKDEADKELHKVLVWSDDVNARVSGGAVENIVAFPNAVKALRRANEMGVDLVAVSGTPQKHVVTQLGIYGIIDCFTAIYGQQAGQKNEALTTMMAGPDWKGKPTPLLEKLTANYDIILMMGDAPKDYEEAKKANKILTGMTEDPVRMFLVEVGRENESWNVFNKELLNQIVAGTWSRDDELARIQRGLDNLDRVLDMNGSAIDAFPLRKK